MVKAIDPIFLLLFEKREIIVAKIGKLYNKNKLICLKVLFF